ncbi:hypothetical protein [Streptomyces sp. IMTB 2501]|uniref:hypothetical protein n=1 Tax=Streptomyces sp. IMTB 2501 TaxID=1776340 RepID=UPI00117C598E|nr:hypothetical protein [Streptomyces sp. IMTB 2501]
MAQAADHEEPVAITAVVPLLTESGEGLFGGALPVSAAPAVVGLVVGVADGGAARPKAFSRTKARTISRMAGASWARACGPGGQGEGEGVQEADPTQDVALIRCQIGEGPGDLSGEVVVKVPGCGDASGAADLEKTHR